MQPDDIDPGDFLRVGRRSDFFLQRSGIIHRCVAGGIVFDPGDFGLPTVLLTDVNQGSRRSGKRLLNRSRSQRLPLIPAKHVLDAHL